MLAILQLRLIAFRGLAPAVSQVFEYDQDEILIGRAADNDFVVDDPERFCSRYHARCYRAENQFFVEDTSTPGTQVNAGHFLNKGHRHRLVTGDLLHIGECQIQVEILQAAAAETQADVSAFSIDDFFADGTSGFDAQPEVKKVPQPNIPYTSPADFYNPQASDPHAYSEQQSMQPVAFETPGNGYAPVDDYPVVPGPDGFGGSAEPYLAGAPAPAESVGYEIPTGYPEQTPVTDYPIEPVLPHTAPVDSVLPLNSSAEPVFSQAAPGEPIFPQAVPAEHVLPQAAPVEPASSRKVQAEHALSQVAPAEPTRVTENKPDTDVDGRAIRAFLQGLDVQPSDLVGRNKEEIMYSAGQMLRVLTQGIMEILLSRNDVKKEFGMDVTRIGAQMNNPLKFSQSASEAMIKLLTEAEGYMSAHDAVKEGVVDAKAHQVAVMAGMQSAIVSMLERFNPESLEEQLSSRFVFSRKGKYWEAYKDTYRQLVSEAEDDFNALFGDEFSLVYRQQVSEIESSYAQE
ncbi:type VI secretion system-associated FHA domain protein TagH [Aliamphritea ceti]|uniref:type VI secretion system-associated FHA domain protein TagH n=1 Tax=Aliamphritea ceti TaxID=1524258 RepID=UPI0021C3B707|nr:type VI secretion system-associated FHA domain protein TagH [Aliamphritea ceti]